MRPVGPRPGPPFGADESERQRGYVVELRERRIGVFGLPCGPDLRTQTAVAFGIRDASSALWA